MVFRIFCVFSSGLLLLSLLYICLFIFFIVNQIGFLYVEIFLTLQAIQVISVCFHVPRHFFSSFSYNHFSRTALERPITYPDQNQPKKKKPRYR